MNKKKEIFITCLFLLISILGVISALFTTTIFHCIILLLISLFALVCGFVIFKYGIEEPVVNEKKR